MFAKQFRLPPTVKLSQASRYTNSFFTLFFAPNSLTLNRYGFVVSKRIDKRATQRNYLKRRFRSCVEAFHPKLHQGYDMLFVLKIHAKEQETIMLSEHIKTCFIHNHLL